MKKLIVLFAMLMVVRLIIAQNKTDSIYSINDLYIDYSAPDISAFSMLGVTEEQIVRPGNLKQFSAGLANLLSSGNKIQTGFATEYSPLNFNKIRKTDWWYKKVRWDNYALSLATAAHDSLGTLLSGGIKWVPLNNSEAFGNSKFYDEVLLVTKSILKESQVKLAEEDSLYKDFILGLVNNNLYKLMAIVDTSFEFTKNEKFYNHQEKIEKGKIQNPIQYFTDLFYNALKLQNVNISKSDSTKILDYSSKYIEWLSKSNSNEEKVKEKILELKANYKKANWYKGSLMFSGGIVGSSKEGTYESLKFRNASFIVSGAIGFPLKKYPKVNAQLILQGKIDGALIDTVEFDNKFSFGGRFLIGNADNRLSAECLYSSTQLSEAFEMEEFDQIRYLKYVLGVELKVSTGTYLELAIGGQKFFEGEKGTSIIPSFTFKHALQTKKRFN